MTQNEMTATERLAAMQAEVAALKAQAQAEAVEALAAAEEKLAADIAALREAAAPELARLRKAAGKGPGRPVGSKNSPKVAEPAQPEG